MIARLRQPIGVEKQTLARAFEVNVRTIERYIVLIKDLGFNVVQHGKRFRIELIEKSGFKQEEYIVFSLEEAKVIKDALLSYNPAGPLRNILLDKLYTMTDIDDLAVTMSKLNHANTISIINVAIKNRYQVVLKAYNSAQSKASDRLVEPIRFHTYYQYLTAYEVKARRVKTFKTDRIAGAEITRNQWVHEKRHHSLGVDPFGISGDKPVKVHLRLQKRAWQLLCEEHPEAAPDVVKKGKLWDYKGEVYGFEGVGRFALGLIDQVEVKRPEGLRGWVSLRLGSGTALRLTSAHFGYAQCKSLSASRSVQVVQCKSLSPRGSV